MRTPPPDLAGTHAIITGGSSGIGAATAHELARRGANVSIVARTVSRLDATAAALRTHGTDIATRSVDVSDRDAVFAALAELSEQQGPCDILITSAGLAHPGHFTELDDDIFRETMAVDYFGTLWPIRAVVPSMIERRTGSVVAVASAAGLIGVFGYSAYGPAKFAVRGLMEALRQELKPHGIHVGCVYPPDVDTPQLEHEDQHKPDETRAISGTIKPLSAEVLARTIVDGIDRRRFVIIPDTQTKIVARTAGLVPGAYAALFDRSIRKAQRRRPPPYR